MHDIWRVGFVRRSQASLMDRGGVTPDEVVWLPPCDSTFQFIADPFGIRRDGLLTIFVEAFDYRVRRGEIHYYQYDDSNRLVGRGPALVEPFHLSYPTLIEDGGELFMLPEGYKSGALTLYRCVRFPDQWEPHVRLLDAPAIDATVVKHGDRWWMFYALPGPGDRAMRELHVAWAEALAGPWTLHPASPVLSGFDTSRPGGTPFEHDGALHLPIQDCTTTYGAAVDVLRIEELTPHSFRARRALRLTPGDLLADHGDGLHTFSGSGDVTCIDVKGIRRSAAEGWIRTQFKVRRLLGLNAPRAPKAARALESA